MTRNVKCMFFRSKCAHAYGAETWDLSSQDVITYLKAVGQAGRRVLGLPPSCPSSVVNTVFGCEINTSHIFMKAMSLIKTFKESRNTIMSCIYNNAINDSNSYISNNIKVVSDKWGGNVKPALIPDVSPVCTGIIELLDVREGAATLELDTDEIDVMMMILCMR